MEHRVRSNVFFIVEKGGKRFRIHDFVIFFSTDEKTNARTVKSPACRISSSNADISPLKESEKREREEIKRNEKRFFRDSNLPNDTRSSSFCRGLGFDPIERKKKKNGRGKTA